MHTDLAAPTAWGTTTTQDTVTLALGAWLVLGVFADGWAHFTVPSLESFFTPWHGVLYSGRARGPGLAPDLRGRGRNRRAAQPPTCSCSPVGY